MLCQVGGISEAFLNDVAQLAAKEIDSRHQSGAKEDMIQTDRRFIQDP